MYVENAEGFGGDKEIINQFGLENRNEITFVVSKERFQEMDSQIKKLQDELISEREFEKIKNQVETSFVQKNTSILGITSSLASYYLLYDNTSLINDEIEIYRSITREDIKEVANKYLNPNQRLDMDYVKKQ